MDKKSYSVEGREKLEHGTAEFPIAIYHGDVATESVPLHWHDEFEAGIVTEGSLCLQVGAVNYTLRQGSAYFINVGQVHGFTAGGNSVSRQHSMVFAPTLVGGRNGSIFWKKYCQPFYNHSEGNPCVLLDRQIAWQADAIRCIERVWDLCLRAYSEYELDVRYQLSHLLSVLCSHLNLQTQQDSEKSRRDNTRIHTMLQFIQDNYASDLTIQDVADSCTISHSECLRCFHDTLGVTPLHYLRDYRLQMAEKALTGTSLPIADIAFACGFQDVSYFIKVFRSEKGITPNSLRQKRSDSKEKCNFIDL